MESSLEFKREKRKKKKERWKKKHNDDIWSDPRIGNSVTLLTTRRHKGVCSYLHKFLYAIYIPVFGTQTTLYEIR